MNNAKSMHIAIVEDDSILREELCHFLEEHGFKVFEAMLGLTLDELLLNESIDLVILDVNLPGESGFEIASRIKLRHSNIGILMLTARTSLSDRVKSYDSGADIYLPKPTHPTEILAALKSLHRRALHGKRLTTDWTLDVEKRQLLSPDSAVRLHLTTMELYILLALIRSNERKIEAGALCDLVRKKIERPSISKRALENSISRLRKKMSEMVEDKNANFIDSIWGYGYRLCIAVEVN